MTGLAPVTKPSEVQNLSRAIEVHGAANVSFVHKDGQTALGRVYYRDPLKFLFPRGDVPTAVLLTTGGGLLGGDVYDVNVHLAENAQSLVTAQAAEKVYRTSGPDCAFDVSLKVDAGACLEWLPQETILFDRSRFRRKTTVDVAKGGSILAGEAIVFGRLASGEEFQNGLVRDAWEIRRDGKLVWADALYLEGQAQHQLDHISAFGGARAMATAVYVNDDAEALLDTARETLKQHDGVRSGATFVNGLLVCRWLAKDPYALRKAFGDFWAEFRNKALGRQASLPRLWHC